MEDVKNTIEEKVIDGLMYMASHPKEVFVTVGMGIWTMLVYRAGCQRGAASILKKTNILMICEKRSSGGR